MKKYPFLCSAIVTAFLASCSNGLPEGANAETDGIAGAICTIPVPTDDSDQGDATSPTRSVITLGLSGMNFSWDAGEKITVFADGQNKGDFTLQKTLDNDPNTGIFTGGGFSLTEGKVYYTISKSSSNYGTDENPKYNIPTINDSRSDFNVDQYTNMKMSYDGQRQTVNGGSIITNADGTKTVSEDQEATAHLGQYDYMTAVATATSANACHFKYQRLGVILRIVMKNLPAKAYKSLTMYDASEDMLRDMNRTTNITNTLSQTEYTPYFNDVTLSSTSKRFTVKLGKASDEGTTNEGIAITKGTSLVVYMMIPPIDLTNKTCAFRLEAVDGTPYCGTYKRTKAFTAGTSVQMAMDYSSTTNPIIESTKYTINIQVMNDWAKGNTLSADFSSSSARANATGDPGNANESPLPKYLYTFFVNNGKLVQMASATPASTDWSTSNNINTLKNTVEWSITTESGTSTGATLTLDNGKTATPRVYVVGSDKAITDWKDASGNSVTFNYSTDNGTDESVIQGLSYNYADHDIKSLYSTAFVDDATFAGTLGDDVKDVRLYHVCSKLDINWENELTTTVNGISVPTPLSGSVSVNNIPTTNLSFFKPTTNAAGSTVVSGADITTGTAYNGRQVWYVPQVSGGKYNVTVGSKTNEDNTTTPYKQDITFTPDDTYTSWFRGLITIK